MADAAAAASEPAGSEALHASEDSLAVGRWGEKLVYHWLLNNPAWVTATYGEGTGRVTWINLDVNRTDPYDITIE